MGGLNRVFELVGMVYGSRPEPGTEAHVEAWKKRKAQMSKGSDEEEDWANKN
jgi:hypothetical protein